MPKGQHLRLLEYVIARLSCMQMGEFSGRKIYTVIRYGDLRIWDSGISRNIYIWARSCLAIFQVSRTIQLASFPRKLIERIARANNNNEITVLHLSFFS